jgi:hypothetical protein
MNQFLTRLAAAILIISIGGCEKTETKVFRDKSDAKADVKNCPVIQVIYSSCCLSKDTTVFAYNSWGDPITVTQLPFPGTGRPNYFFKYDKKRRLTELLGLYRGGNIGEVWHKYFYENPGKSDVVLDSSYFFPWFQNGIMVSYHTASATYFTYDKSGRIIKDSTIYQAGEHTSVNNYVYDANGNLWGSVYDNRTNMNQTHPIWMFLDRNYSLNNPFEAQAYNSAGLPTIIKSEGQYFSPLRVFLSFREATISYGCQ